MDYPILQDSLLVKGTYEDVSQFMANAPRLHALMTEDSMAKATNPGRVWGYCDGKIIYVRNGCCQFYPFARDHGGFTSTIFHDENAYAQALLEKKDNKQKIKVANHGRHLPFSNPNSPITFSYSVI